MRPLSVAAVQARCTLPSRVSVAFTREGAPGAVVSGTVRLTAAAGPVLPPASTAATVYATVVPGRRPVSVKSPVVGEPTAVPSRVTT